MECRKHTEAEYQRQGIHMYPTFCPQKVEKDPDGHFTVIAKNSQGKEMALTGMDCVLMATGRKPNSRGLGLEEVRIFIDSHVILIDCLPACRMIGTGYSSRVCAERLGLADRQGLCWGCESVGIVHMSGCEQTGRDYVQLWGLCTTVGTIVRDCAKQ